MFVCVGLCGSVWVCVCLCGYGGMCMCMQVQLEVNGIKSPEAGVTGFSEPPNMNTRNWKRVISSWNL